MRDNGERCDSKDYECFQRAFFSKKERLDAIHAKHISDAKK
jgi:hypothetical protein